MWEVRVLSNIESLLKASCFASLDPKFHLTSEHLENS